MYIDILFFLLIVVPILLISSFVWLAIKVLKLDYKLEENIKRLEQKAYYLEKLILILNNDDKLSYNDLSDLLKDDTDLLVILKKYEDIKRNRK